MKKQRIWTLWFLLIVFVTYSPLAAPYNKTTPTFFGFPFTLFMWMILTILLLFSVIFFANYVWRD